MLGKPNKLTKRKADWVSCLFQGEPMQNSVLLKLFVLLAAILGGSKVIAQDNNVSATVPTQSMTTGTAQSSTPENNTAQTQGAHPVYTATQSTNQVEDEEMD